MPSRNTVDRVAVAGREGSLSSPFWTIIQKDTIESIFKCAERFLVVNVSTFKYHH